MSTWGFSWFSNSLLLASPSHPFSCTRASSLFLSLSHQMWRRQNNNDETACCSGVGKRGVLEKRGTLRSEPCVCIVTRRAEKNINYKESVCICGCVRVRGNYCTILFMFCIEYGRHCSLSLSLTHTRTHSTFALNRNNTWSCVCAYPHTHTRITYTGNSSSALKFIRILHV